MADRVVVGLIEGAQAVPWPALRAQLLAAGAAAVADPVSYQPDAVVATLAAGTDAAAFIQQVQALPGVRYAQADAWAGTGPLMNAGPSGPMTGSGGAV